MNGDLFNNDLFHQFEAGLKSTVDDSGLDYDYIEKQIIRRIQAAELDGALSLLKVDEFLPNSILENAEKAVAMRICKHTQYEEPIDECIKAESSLPDMYWRHFYKGLEQKVAPMSRLSDSEQVLKVEEILPMGKWENVEEPLFKRIESYEKAQIQNVQATGIFWNIVRQQYKRATVFAALAALAVGIWQGNRYYQSNYQPIASTLYQVQGPSINVIKSLIPLQGTLCSELGGSMTMINKYGYVELHNGSSLEILKASQKKVLYKAEFAHADKQLVGQGSITFFVNKQKTNEKFTVSTGDYRIEVVGTYFKLQPDLKGHVAVSVKEGQVKIVFANGDVKILKAGESLAYDMNYNSYYSTGGGTIVARQEIEQLPDIHDLGDYKQVYIATNIPNAGIRIDGKFVGMSPIIILQPQGYHAISIEKNGYTSRDTTVLIEASHPSMYAIDLREIKAELATANSGSTAKSFSAVNARPSEKLSTNTTDTLIPNDSAKIYFQKAETKESSHWQEAVLLYQQVAADRNAPQLQKEAASFSIAKLLADHGVDKAKAKEGFFNYLALYPTGNFVGESLLRLAELEFEHDQDKAIEYYLKYFDKYPKHFQVAELQERVGLMYLQKKKYDDALGMFKLALSNIQGDNQNDKSKILSNIYKTLREKESAQQTQTLGTDNSANSGRKH